MSDKSKQITNAQLLVDRIICIGLGAILAIGWLSI